MLSLFSSDKKAICCCVGSVAFILRIACLVIRLQQGGWESVSYASEMGQIAANIAEGRGFSSPFENGSQPTAWFGPLVPIFWAGVFKAAGIFSGISLVIIGIMQCIASALACVIHSYLCLSLLDLSKYRRRNVYAGMLLLALLPLSILASSTRFWYYSWQELLLALAMLCSVRWYLRSRMADAVCFGVAAGICLLINPVPLLVYVAALIGILWNNTFNRNAIVQGLACAAVCGVILLPWSLRNMKELKHAVPLRSNFGVELYQGNNPNGEIVQTSKARHPASNADERRLYYKLGEVSYCQAKMHEAFRYMWHNPGISLKRSMQRAYVFWFTDIFDNWPWVPRSKWWTMGSKMVGGKLVRIFINILLFAGGCYALASRPLRTIKGWWILVLVPLMLPVPYYFTHVNPMYAFAVQPYLLILTLCGILNHTKASYIMQNRPG